MSALQPFRKDLWVMDGEPVRMYTIPFTTRMTVIRLESGGLWVHSPITPTPECLAEIENLGSVEYIIAPNRIHSLGIKPWKTLYPQAEVWVSPKFLERHRDIEAEAVFSDDSTPEWRNEIEHHVFAGSFYLDEVIFFHRKSQTIIITDIIQKHAPSQNSWFWKQVKRLAGVLGKGGGVSLDLKATFSNKNLAKKSKETILSWDFKHLIISHGYCVKENAKPIVEKSFSWL